MQKIIYIIEYNKTHKVNRCDVKELAHRVSFYNKILTTCVQSRTLSLPRLLYLYIDGYIMYTVLYYTRLYSFRYVGRCGVRDSLRVSALFFLHTSKLDGLY